MGLGRSGNDIGIMMGGFLLLFIEFWLENFNYLKIKLKFSNQNSKIVEEI